MSKPKPVVPVYLTARQLEQLVAAVDALNPDSRKLRREKDVLSSVLTDAWWRLRDSVMLGKS